MGTDFLHVKPNTVPVCWSIVLCHVMDLLCPFEDCQQVLHRMTHSEEHARQSFEIRPCLVVGVLSQQMAQLPFQ